MVRPCAMSRAMDTAVAEMAGVKVDVGLDASVALLDVLEHRVGCTRRRR